MIGRVFLGRYEARRLLGEGGMGRVYLARQLDLNRQVVIKVMHEHIASDPTFRERFERETNLMARFSHPYVVSLYDASLNDPLGPCIIMEYIRGVNLDQLLASSGRFTAARVGRLLGQLCEALQAAHDMSIIHRDLKPANVMVIDADTPREKVKVMDFGLAKDPEEMKKVTDTNIDFAVGTPGYICPEQIRGEEMDQRGDIYSLGVILYELLSGRLPFNGPTSMDIMLAHATEVPPTFAEVGVEGWVPPGVEEVIRACLEKDPALRPQSARELADRYDAALAQPLMEADFETYPNMNDPMTPRGGIRAVPQPGGVAAPQVPVITDPNVLAFQMEAWMPEKIAIVKLRGFVHDMGGEVAESVPGMVRVRIGAKAVKTPLSWFGFGRRNEPLELELRLIQIDPQRENRLHISVLFRPSHPSLLGEEGWRDRCGAVFVELRAYLMGV